MTKTILFLVLIISYSFTGKGQEAGYKTIPGVFTNDIWGPDWRIMSVTPDGKEVVFNQGILKPGEGRFVSYPLTWLNFAQYPGRITPDHSFTYCNDPAVEGYISSHYAFVMPPGEPKDTIHLSALKSFSDDKLQKIYIDTNYIVGANNQNQLFVSTAWLGAERRLGGLKGLRLFEPKTGKVIKVLRTDTIFRGGVYPPIMYFNSTYTAILTIYSIYGWPIVYGSTTIRPFNSDSVINAVIGENPRRYLMSDNDYIYNASGNDLAVFSMHTGKLLYKVIYPAALQQPPYHYRRCLYAQAGNGRLYRLDQETAKIYEEEVTPDSLHTLKTYPLHIEKEQSFLAANQWYDIVAAGGPSLIIVPRLRIDGDLPGNAGYVINLPTGKISLKIAPFYNASNEQIVKEKLYRENEIADAAKTALDKRLKDGSKYKLGASFRKKGEGYTSDECFVVNYDAVKNVYGFVTRTYVGPKKTVFKSNANVAHYTLSYQDVEESYIDTKYTPTGKVYQFCSVCKGSGVSYTTQQRTTGGWEQVNFNVYVFTPYQATASWDERVICGQCYGVGIKEVY